MLNNYANEDTPRTGRYWRNLTDKQRVNALKKIINSNDYFQNISSSRAHEDGQVFVILSENIDVSQRGSLLLDFEDYIKKTLDGGLNVWCEPL